MKQVARNLTDSIDGFLLGSRYLIMDRDTKFCVSSLSIIIWNGTTRAWTIA